MLDPEYRAPYSTLWLTGGAHREEHLGITGFFSTVIPTAVSILCYIVYSIKDQSGRLKFLNSPPPCRSPNIPNVNDHLNSHSDDSIIFSSGNRFIVHRPPPPLFQSIEHKCERIYFIHSEMLVTDIYMYICIFIILFFYIIYLDILAFYGWRISCRFT